MSLTFALPLAVAWPGPARPRLSLIYACAAVVAPRPTTHAERVERSAAGRGPTKAPHHSHHPRHDARGSHGLSRIHARSDAEPGCARQRIDRLHPRVRAGADHHRVARDDSHGNIST